MNSELLKNLNRSGEEAIPTPEAPSMVLSPLGRGEEAVQVPEVAYSCVGVYL